MSSSRTQVFKGTEGVLSRVTDATLAFLFYFGEVATSSGRTMYDFEQAAERAHRSLEQINYQSIKRALYELRRKGFVQRASTSAELEITTAGRRRLKKIIPQYQANRPWDQKIYVVTYDIPIEKNRDRDRLREFLRKIGCGLLQKSIWITPYNPMNLIKEFTNEWRLHGFILVSVLGKDGSIGGMSMDQLLEQVYRLSNLNERYRAFLEQCKSERGEKMQFSYLALLQDDPQLPFELLPDDWLGEVAYRRVSDSKSQYMR